MFPFFFFPSLFLPDSRVGLKGKWNGGVGEPMQSLGPFEIFAECSSSPFFFPFFPLLGVSYIEIFARSGPGSLPCCCYNLFVSKGVFFFRLFSGRPMGDLGRDSGEVFSPHQALFSV